MAAFDSFDHFTQYSDEILDLLEDFSSPAFVNHKVLEAVEAGDSDRRMSTSINVSMSDPVSRVVESDGIAGMFGESFIRIGTSVFNRVLILLL